MSLDSWSFHNGKSFSLFTLYGDVIKIRNDRKHSPIRKVGYIMIGKDWGKREQLSNQTKPFLLSIWSGLVAVLLVTNLQIIGLPWLNVTLRLPLPNSHFSFLNPMLSEEFETYEIVHPGHYSSVLYERGLNNRKHYQTKTRDIWLRATSSTLGISQIQNAGILFYLFFSWLWGNKTD